MTIADTDNHRPVQVGVVFHAGAAVFPIDVGLVEPVIVLNAMGYETGFSCEGHVHGYSVAYLTVECAQFPDCLLSLLTADGVNYDLANFKAGVMLSAAGQADNERFSAALRKWARAKAPDVLYA